MKVFEILNHRLHVVHVPHRPRLRQEFYGLKKNDSLFYQRIVKEAVHELGHAFGLSHCNKFTCVMHFSNSLRDTDIKENNFCNNCRTRL
jgi:archaemetzincin